MYEIRIRPWWIDNPDWPDGVEPCATPWEEAYLHSTCDTEKEAVAICKKYNSTWHNRPDGPNLTVTLTKYIGEGAYAQQSWKAEFMEVGDANE